MGSVVDCSRKATPSLHPKRSHPANVLDTPCDTSKPAAVFSRVLDAGDEPSVLVILPLRS
jgi:hypothetical protein